MNEPGKRIKGSAIVDEEGGFVFTPYQIGASERKMRLIAAVKHGALLKGPKSYSLRLKIDRNNLPPLHRVVAEIMELYTAARKDHLKL